TANPEDKRFVLKEENQPGGSTANATGQGAPRRLHLVGRVVDAETGRAVDRFNVLMDENRGTQLKFVGEGRDGRFDWQYPVQFFNQFGLEIEAEGYAPEASALASIKDPEQTYEFKLKKSSDIRGQVVSSDGQPIAGADVFLGGRGMGPSMAHSPVRGYFLVSNEREHEGHTDLH